MSPALLLAFLLQDAPLPVDAPATPATDPIEEARAARLKEDRVRFEAFAAAVDRFGHHEEFAARVRELLAGATDRFVRVKEGSVTDASLADWLAWNLPRESSGKLASVDVGAEAHPLTAIVDLHNQLRAHGVDFLLVTMPSRAQLYPELLMDLPEGQTWDGFSGFCPGTSQFVLALNDAGVEVCYLAPEFVAQRYGKDGDRSDQLFLQDNQHWTPRAAEIAARAVAERLAKYPWYKPGPAKEKVDFVVKERQVKVGIVWSRAPDWSKTEILNASQVVQLRGVTSLRPSSPITLISGSFADFHQTNGCDFTTQLYRHSGWPIDKINPRGGVEEQCRQELANNRAKDMKKGKKDLVIWLMAEAAFRPGPMWGPVKIFDD